MRIFRSPGTPSSSMLIEPRAFETVPSSMTVTSSLPTFCPSLPVKSEVPLRMKSASSP